MFRVKICGITNLDDALAAAEAGADAVGLNFYAKSPRCCSLELAEEIVRAVPGGICKVGVFVNSPAEEVKSIVRKLGLDLAQLHGDESPEFLRDLRGVPLMRAFRVGNNLDKIGTYLDQCHRLTCLPRLVLLDASRQGEYGGTGQAFDWSIVERDRHLLRGIPLVLAGGITPDNVAEGIVATKPWGVDTASGVETAPGRKSAERMARYVAEAHAVFKRRNAPR